MTKLHFNILECIWSKERKGVTAKEIYDDMIKEGKSLSKATILGFLDELCEMDMLRISSESCRGGIRKRYFQLKSKEKFIEKFIGYSIEEIMLKYPQETLTSLYNITQRDTFTDFNIIPGLLGNIAFPDNPLQEPQESSLWSLNNPLSI